jgi:hypothetical protein
VERRYIEVGIGNDCLCSTEVEASGYEYRVPGVSIGGCHLVSAYMRVWIGHHQIVLQSDGKPSYKKRSKSRVKVLIGIGLRR